MRSPLRNSTLRLAAGGALAVLAAAVLGFALPGAAARSRQASQAAQAASRGLASLQKELGAYQALDGRLRANRQVLERLLAAMPEETVGRLQWMLSRKLFELAGRSRVRLVGVKYGAPSREGKGSALEVLDAEFTVVGIYPDLKAFMLALEDGRLPFAVVSAKLDQTPDGAQLNVVLRAFRQAPGEAL